MPLPQTLTQVMFSHHAGALASTGCLYRDDLWRWIVFFFVGPAYLCLVALATGVQVRTAQACTRVRPHPTRGFGCTAVRAWANSDPARPLYSHVSTC